MMQVSILRRKNATYYNAVPYGRSVWLTDRNRHDVGVIAFRRRGRADNGTVMESRRDRRIVSSICGDEIVCRSRSSSSRSIAVAVRAFLFRPTRGQSRGTSSSSGSGSTNGGDRSSGGKGQETGLGAEFLRYFHT